jgi:hypothetical protein
MGRFRRRLLGVADDKEAEEEEEDELRLEPEEIRAGKDAESRDERMSASKTPWPPIKIFISLIPPT